MCAVGIACMHACMHASNCPPSLSHARAPSHAPWLPKPCTQRWPASAQARCPHIATAACDPHSQAGKPPPPPPLTCLHPPRAPIRPQRRIVLPTPCRSRCYCMREATQGRLPTHCFSPSCRGSHAGEPVNCSWRKPVRRRHFCGAEAPSHRRRFPTADKNAARRGGRPSKQHQICRPGTGTP